MATLRITAPYSAAESWGYDRFIAPAVAELAGELTARIDPLLPRGGALLDVGCGGGQNLLAIARRRPDAKLTGVDLSAEQVGRALARATAAGAKVSVVEGSALTLPFADESFDAVLSVASIKHWPDPALGLRECVRVLRPGGKLRVIEVDRGCRLDDARRFVGRWRLPGPVRRLCLPLFHTYVAGQGLDLDDARALLAPLGLLDASVERLDGMPALMIGGTKPS
ncbi:MAG TPA: class I SAM-dependent methyltransferase [Polyangiaceae bacterium]|nr:class I SAM-dependent methyltransferase [Polyangiaceae bacterium]